MPMPTIMTPSTPSGPKIVLSSSPNTNTPVQPIPHISQPAATPVEPIHAAPSAVQEQPAPTVVQSPSAATVEEPKTTPAAEAAAKTKPENIFELVSNAEAEIIKKLAIQHAEESGLISKMKTLISETDKVEESEGALQKKLTELQELRRNMEAEPDKAIELLTSAGLHKDVEPSVPPVETKVEPVKATPLPPAAQQPLAPVSPQQRVLNALQQTFSNTDATIAAMLPANATIERSADKNGVIVSSEHGQIHFSNDDLKQAGVAPLELSDIPYAVRQEQSAPSEPTQSVPETPLKTPAPPEPQSATPVTQQPAELTEVMKKLIAVLEKNPPASIAATIKNITAIYRSPDSNGILVMDGNTTTHLSDAELIQADVSGEDIAELPTGTPDMMPAAPTTTPA